MIRIYNIHNVVTNYNPNKLTHRNCLDYDAFSTYLEQRVKPFDKLKNAMKRREGEVMTIDDATNGAFDAAMLCAVFKKHATIFINPYNVETGKTYYMSYLTCYLEQLEAKEFVFNEQHYDLTKRKNVKHLRKDIKSELCKIDDEDERIEWLENTFQKSAQDLIIPNHLRTMSKRQLSILHQNKYIDIEYHGWTHTNLASMSVSQILSELEMGRAWFHENLSSDICFFALPFGKRDTRIENLLDFPDILLSDNELDASFSKRHIANRMPLDLELDLTIEERNADDVFVDDDGVMFSLNKNVLIQFPRDRKVTNYTIPDTVKVIGQGAFNRCHSLIHLVIPKSVNLIKRGAFSNCVNLHSIHIPDSVVEIANMVFYACENLEHVTFENAIIGIGDSAFAHCTSLREIAFPDSVTDMGDSVFIGCKNLRKVELSSRLTTVKETLFNGCTNLECIIAPAGLDLSAIGRDFTKPIKIIRK